MITDKSKYENLIRASAFMQLRICDLAACLKKTHLPGETVRFNLELDDPITGFLDDDLEWQGIAGNYVVTLGPESEARAGSDAKLPTMKASVGAFTRMWLGVLSASTLAVCDQLSADAKLLDRLDNLIRVPRPTPDWCF